ncbi:MAG: hypothetical protein M8858_08170 [marine benthic group bacterium]|nr:hypothetical protein [Gemmatimonadota bacterium]
MDLADGLVITGIALGIVVNLVALMALIWKFGSWSGKVTTLLDAHAEDHKNHYTTTDQHTRQIARLQGTP